MKRILPRLRKRSRPAMIANHAIDPSKPVLSCVVDDQPKFLMQSWIWLVSAHVSGAFDQCNVVIHHVGPAPAVLTQAARRFGAQLVQVEPFGEGAARYCNKLQSHAPLLSMNSAGVILTDVDLFFLSSPHLSWSPVSVRSKIVDHPNPPLERLSSLVEAFGLAESKYKGVPTFRPETRTHELNCNGGLYALPQKALEKIVPMWRDYAIRCLAQKDILGQWLHHSDQIGFMMSMMKTDLSFESLDPSWNFPTHFKPDAYSERKIGDLNILHYHDKISSKGRLLRTEVAELDHHIDRANDILSDYEHCPEFEIIQDIYAASLS